MTKIIRQNAAAKILLVLLFIGAGAMQANADDAVWIDVRSAEEYAGGHIEMSKNIPHTEIATKIQELELNKDANIKVYCRSGMRAGMAKKSLEDLGYTNVENVGGLEDAKKIVAK